MARIASERGASDSKKPAPPAAERARQPDRPAASVAPGPAPWRQLLRASGLQRKCACGGRCAACQEEEARRLQRFPAGSGARGDAALALRPGGGQPLAASVAAEFGARFGHDFGGVRIRSDDAAARAVDALAFTVGTQIVFRDGAFAPGTSAGRSLLAHELAHVVQQRGASPRTQRWGDAPDHYEREADLAAERAVSGRQVGPLTPISGRKAQRAPAGGHLVVEDDVAGLEPGQMRRTEFLRALRASVCAVAEAALAGSELTTAGCPYLDRWFAYYSTRSSEHLERAMRLYAPEIATATTADGAIRLVSERVRAGVARWAATGDLAGVPPELVAAFGGGGLGAAGAAAVGSAVSGAVSAVGSTLSGLFGKPRPGGLRPGPDPGAVRERLGQGRPLDGQVRSTMESAFGMSFAPVRVHTDGGAAGLSERLNARAFTVGTDVAFGAGEFRPGTLTGDSLIAHELAHVAQQSRSGTATAAELETDADSAAATALLGGRASPSRTAGLSLQRCSKKAAAPPLGATDYLVTARKDEPGETTSIYFDRGSGAIDPAELPKIAATVALLGAGSALTLNAYRSEDEPAGLAATRAAAVDAALGASVPPHTGARTSAPQPAHGLGRIDYRDLRKVDVQVPALGLVVAPPAEPDCAAGPVTACGAAFGLAQPRATAMLTAAIGKLDPLTPAASGLLEELFGGPASGPATAPTVKARLTALRLHVAAMSGPGRHRCHNECDALCKESLAYNQGLGAGAVMTLCPGFLTNADVDDNAGTLIHEGAHGTTGLATTDIAYGHTRLIRTLVTADALKNTDSYTLLVRLLHTPGSVTIGVAGDVRTGMLPAEEHDAAAALGHLEKWLTASYQTVSSAYDTVGTTIAAGAWTNGYYRKTVHLIAPSFPGLTDPGAAAPFTLPTFDDQMKLAAIYDRFLRMRTTMWSRGVTMKKIPAGVDSWALGTPSTVELTPAFFALPTTTARVRRLIELLATALPDVSPFLVSRYVDAADAIRGQSGLGP